MVLLSNVLLASNKQKQHRWSNENIIRFLYLYFRHNYCFVFLFFSFGRKHKIKSIFPLNLCFSCGGAFIYFYCFFLFFVFWEGRWSPSVNQLNITWLWASFYYIISLWGRCIVLMCFILCLNYLNIFYHTALCALSFGTCSFSCHTCWPRRKSPAPLSGFVDLKQKKQKHNSPIIFSW